MSSYFDDVGQETEMKEAAAVSAAPHYGTNGDGLIQSAAPISYNSNNYEATAQGGGNVVTPNSSYDSQQFNQFEDAPEEIINKHHLQEPSSSNITSRGKVQAVAMNGAATAPSSLDALALACAQHERDGATTMDISTGTSTPVVSNMTNEGADSASAGGSSDKAVMGTVVNGSNGNIDVAFEISNSDVLCGRGGLTNHHPGNVFFRQLVRMKQESYLRATKRDKAGVARDIVDTIRRLDPSGRFLKKDPSNPGQWIEIGNRKAREKTSQALREGAPELREELTGKAQIPVPQGGFPTKPITSAERQEAQQATMDSLPRGRVVSSDNVNGSGWTEVDLAQYQGPSYQVNNNGVNQPHMIFDETSDAAVATVTPLTLTPSTSSSSTEPMDTSSGSTTPPPGTNYCGTKRKLKDAVQNQSCSWQEMQQDAPSPSSASNKQRGPRMKLLKARMTEFCR